MSTQPQLMAAMVTVSSCSGAPTYAPAGKRLKNSQQSQSIPPHRLLTCPDQAAFEGQGNNQQMRTVQFISSTNLQHGHVAVPNLTVFEKLIDACQACAHLALSAHTSSRTARHQATEPGYVCHAPNSVCGQWSWLNEQFMTMHIDSKRTVVLTFGRVCGKTGGPPKNCVPSTSAHTHTHPWA